MYIIIYYIILYYRVGYTDTRNIAVQKVGVRVFNHYFRFCFHAGATNLFMFFTCSSRK
jgi:hypothetical protein